MITQSYQEQIAAILRDLGIPDDYGFTHGLDLQPEETDLEVARVLSDGRTLRLSRSILPRWNDMVRAAIGDGITLLLISGFRSVDHQRTIIEGKLAKGISMVDILKVNAAPGFSEHHTGRAVDIGSPGCSPLSEAFEMTEAFAWLTRNAGKFGFRMSYPRGHFSGFIYEPWHWIG